MIPLFPLAQSSSSSSSSSRDPWEPYYEEDKGKGKDDDHDNNGHHHHPIVPESNVTGLFLVGFALAFLTILRLCRRWRERKHFHFSQDCACKQNGKE